MKKQLLYRSPDINEYGGGDDEQQPVDETSADAGEETGPEDGATDEDNTDTADENSTEDSATDEDNTDTVDESSNEGGATDEDNTSGEETSSEDGATDEDNTNIADENSSEDGATDEDNTNVADENSNEDGATDENNTEEGETSTNEEETPKEGNTEEGETSSNEEETPKESNTEEGETSSNEEETPKEGSTEEGETSSNEEETPKEGSTEEGETSSNEEETPKEGNTEEGETSSNEEETPKEGNTEEKEPLVEEEFPKNNNAGGQQSSNEEEPPKENSTVSTPPVAVVWPGNLSQTPVTTPGDELSTFIAAIKTNRTNVPEHLTDKNKVKNGYMYDPFSGKPQPQPASIQPDTVDAWIWEELRSEGSYTSINTYDNMIVTWGRGVAGANIAKVLKSVFSAHSNIQTEFNNVGIGLNANGILQVVDTTQNCVKEASFALQTIKADKKLLDFLVDISLNDNYKEVSLDAQWNFVKTFNSTLFAYVNASKWSKDAVQLMFHFNWWLPAYAWNGHPQTYKDTAGDVHKIIYIFAGNLNKNSVLVVYLKKFAGNAFSKYVAKPEYETQPAGEHIVFEDGGKTYYFPKL